jgi:methylated-DNA-[protein]-cysteine S-methyltransferase
MTNSPTLDSPALLPRAAADGAAAVRHDSPLGALLIHVSDGSITCLDIAADDDPDFDAAVPDPLHDAARHQLDEYFAGRRRRFDLPLDQAGTPFQRQVWNALGDVPWGTATSYGDLAARVDRPTGARAVGGAIRANRIALLVPCHRVLGTGGRLTGYSPGSGVPTKRWLLEHEGIEYREDPDSREG